MKRTTHQSLISIKAVLFDMDGVIVDSMPYHFISWFEALQPYGVRLSCQDVYSREGERWDKTMRALLKKNKHKRYEQCIQKIFKERKKIFRKHFKVIIFDGVVELISQLKSSGCLVGLVTGSPLVEIKRILPKTLLNKFNVVVAGDQVTHGKPHPEPFLKAAKGLKLNPGQCVVVENSQLGIQSAKRAKMKCIAFTSSLPAECLTCADFIAGDYKTIHSILRQIISF